MSERFPGGFVTMTPPSTTGGMSGTAPGVWTVDQAMQKVKDGAWPQQPVWGVEDVFSAWMYTGTGASLTINNGIDLAGRGGLVWGKCRNSTATDHWVYDTARGFGKPLTTNNSNAQADNGDYFGVKQFNSNGFDIAANDSGQRWNSSGYTYATWTFRKQPKFFDVVTWTGDGTSAKSIAHNLGSAPGCIIVKAYSANSYNWAVYHRSLSDPTRQAIYLDLTNGESTVDSRHWNDTAPTSTNFTVGTFWNGSGVQFVAYLFAHDAGGFGLTGTDSVISCGSYTGTGAGAPPSITLGWEPQWILIKSATNGSQNWNIFDTMRGLPVGGVDALFLANSSDAEISNTDYISVNATGFQVVQGNGNATNQSGATYIYIAIRRGPMRVPTSGTSVYKPVAYTGTGTGTNVDFGFPLDAYLQIGRSGSGHSNLSGYAWPLFTRLLSFNNAINTTMTNAWGGGWGNSYLTVDNNFGVRLVDSYYLNVSGGSYSLHGFRRAPGFMDIVAYTGTGATLTVNHGLGVVPELVIFKRRDSPSGWPVWRTGTGTGTTFGNLNDSSAEGDQGTSIFPSLPTSTAMSLTAWGAINASGGTYIAYLFATCPGVSKVGTYTGTGAAQTIDCGFTSGARFVLIKRANGAGDWIMYDTARGIVNGNDPYIRINSVGTEVTGTDYISPQSVGFGLTASAPADLNASGGTYIYLAIA